MSSPSKMVAEWHPVDAIILAWPNKNTDWAPWLIDARNTYLTIINVLNRNGTGVLLLCAQDDIEELTILLPKNANVLIVPANYNDTWVRDYGFITCKDTQGNGYPVEFCFNGWGEKFDAQQDNLVNKNYLASLCKNNLRTSSVVAEGGALEIDEEGTLLSTAQCLLNPKRNGSMSLVDYQNVFSEHVGCSNVIILQNGHLEGDDTDGHIDTLVRFTPNNGLVIQTADNRPQDSHFNSLQALCDECEQVLPKHKQYKLPLPYITNQQGDRLPASYANFLICNKTVLLPIYNEEEDSQAIRIIQQAYPNFKIEPVDCAALIKQYGSLHCISMQVPSNTLKQAIVSRLKEGVSVYALK